MRNIMCKLICLFLLVGATYVYGQKREMPIYSLKEEVNKNFINWAMRGEFEKAEDYKNRMSQKEKYLDKFVFDAFATRIKDIIVEIHLLRYDIDNEEYHIKIEEGEKIKSYGFIPFFKNEDVISVDIKTAKEMKNEGGLLFDNETFEIPIEDIVIVEDGYLFINKFKYYNKYYPIKIDAPYTKLSDYTLSTDELGLSEYFEESYNISGIKLLKVLKKGQNKGSKALETTMAVIGTAYGQADTDIVNIPDENFKKFLLDDFEINLNGDWEITYEEARAYTGRIDVSNRGIKSLTGIEAFINIIGLDCYDNPLKRLDVSKNTALQRLNCSKNELTSLDVSNNIALQELKCSSNQLISLDVSNNIALKDLMCHKNQLANLDVSKNILLESLNCYDNKLTYLDLSKNTALGYLDCSDNQLTQINLTNGNNDHLISVDVTINPKLKCIQIDTGFTPSIYYWKKDSNASYRYICN